MALKRSRDVNEPGASCDAAYIEACLDALCCPATAQLVRDGQSITSRDAFRACDPTAVLRVAALTHPDKSPVFPQFQRDAIRLLNFHGVPLKLRLGQNTLRLFTHQLKALRFLRGRDAQIDKDPNSTRGTHGSIAVLKMGLGKTLIAMAYACMLPHPVAAPMGHPHPSLRRKFPTLVVASKTVMTMWQLDGFEKFFDPNSIRVLYLHKDWISQSQIDGLNRDAILQYDFVVTTYDVILNLSRKHPETLDGILEYGRMGVWGESPDKVKTINLRTRRAADRPDWTGLRVLYGTPWKLVIADESQRFANPKTKTFRAMMGLYGHRKLCLTGTPIRNYKTDLWSQLRWMGYSGILKPQQWRPLYMRIHNLSTCILVINYEDTDIVMPPRIETKHQLDFSDFENQVYEFVLKKAQEALDQMLKRKLSFVCVLAMFTRLRQVCIAPYLITTMSKRGTTSNSTLGSTYAQEVLAELEADGPLWSQIKDRTGPAGMGSTKIQAIVDEIRAVPAGEKVLVFSMFTSALDLIAGALDGHATKLAVPSAGSSSRPLTIEGELFDDGQPLGPVEPVEPAGPPPIGYEQLDGGTKDRAETMRRFKSDPNCRVLLITYKVGSEGLNLTEANHVILTESWWCAAVPDQAMARAWRPGQTKPVTMHDLIVNDSIENKVVAICEQKKAMAATYLSNTTTLDDAVTQSTAQLDMRTLRTILGGRPLV